MTFFVKDVPPHLLYAGRLSIQKGEPFYRSLHNHPDWAEFLLIRQGHGTYIIGGKSYSVTPGSLVIYNPGEWHEEFGDSYFSHEILYLGCTGIHLSGAIPGRLIPTNSLAVLPPDPQIILCERWFHLLLAEKAAPANRATMATLDYLLAILLTHIAAVAHPNLAHAPDTRSEQIVAQIKHFIHAHYHEPMTLSRISQEVSLTPYHLSRVFKSVTGMSPIQYTLSYRLDAAKRYLLTTNETVEQIAQRVGYERSTYFQSVFKKYTGSAPGQYRKAHR